MIQRQKYHSLLSTVMRDHIIIHTQSSDGILVEVLELYMFVAQYVWIWCPALLIFLQKITGNERSTYVT